MPINLSPHPLEPGFDAPAFLDNPYPFLQTWQCNTPVFRNPEDVVYLTRYADCVELLSNPAFRRSPSTGDHRPFSTSKNAPNPFEVMISHWMLFMDPPRHDLVRKAFARAFTAKAIAQLEPLIRDEAKQLLESWPTAGTVEVVQQFAFALPVRVIIAMVGLPRDDAPLFQEWAAHITEALDSGTEESLRRGSMVVPQLKTYFSDIIGNRQTLPPHCLINAILDTEDSELTPDEFVYGLVALLWAGHETTKNLIANGILLLEQEPQQHALLQQQPDLLISAVEEMLRFESPVQKLSRWTHEDARFGDYLVPAGTLVTALIGAANRDPAQFNNADTFDIQRKKNCHIAFGTGLHHCLGAALARLEARIAFAELLPRLAHVKLIEFNWRRFSAFRSLEDLTIEVHRP